MRRILFLAVLTVLPTWAVAGERTGSEQSKPRPPQRPAESNPCAIYGAGFVKIEGSSTCVRIGGSITVDVGGKVAR